MKSIIAVLTLALSLASISASASAEEGIRRKTVQKTVFAGKRTRLGDQWHIGQDCRTIDVPAHRIIEKPKNGRIEVVQEGVFPSPKSSRGHCSKVKAKGAVTYYTAKPGYEGSDRAVLRMEIGDGVLGDMVINIRVVK
jgi:hypothetical protein